MDERTKRRVELELTQEEAARKAGVSLATWRRWELDPGSVSMKTRVACEDVLEATSDFERALSKSYEAFADSWKDSSTLTPRQAYAISLQLDLWADTDIAEWLRDPSEPLHEVSPFDHFDLRVMMHVGENRAWAEGVRQRCYVVSDEIQSGTLPFDRPEPLIDEILIGAALDGAQGLLEDMPELFAKIPSRDGIFDDEHFEIGDDDWEVVAEGFSDACGSDDWEIPLWKWHPLLPLVLTRRPPFTWFDLGGTSG